MTRALAHTVLALGMLVAPSTLAAIEFWQYQTSSKLDDEEISIQAWLFRDSGTDYFLQIKAVVSSEKNQVTETICTTPSTTLVKRIYSANRTFKEEVSSDTLSILSGVVEPKPSEDQAQKSYPGMELTLNIEIKGDKTKGDSKMVRIDGIQPYYYDSSTLDGDLQDIRKSCEEQTENPNLPTRTWVPQPAQEKHFVEFVRKSSGLKSAATAKKLLACMRQKYQENLWSFIGFGFVDSILEDKIDQDCKKTARIKKSPPRIVHEFVRAIGQRATTLLPWDKKEYVFSNRFNTAVNYLFNPLETPTEGAFYFDVQDQTQIFVVAPLTTKLEFGGYTAGRGGQFYVERY